MRYFIAYSKQLMTDLRSLRNLFFFCLLIPFICHPKSVKEVFYVQKTVNSQSDTLLNTANTLYANKEYSAAIIIYERIIRQGHTDSNLALKNIALSSAAIQDAQSAALYAERYIRQTADIAFLKNSAFKAIEDSKSFKKLEKSYTPGLNIWSAIYLYIAIVGTFIAMILNFKKNSDRIANLLISAFIFMHSLFVIHLCLRITNYKYYFPNTLLATTSFSFLYGPLLYFYFKRITRNYVLKLKDGLHLLPLAGYLVYAFPLYTLTRSEKLELLLNEQKLYVHVVITVIAKLIFLFVYGYLVWNMYKKSNKSAFKKDETLRWQRNILKFYMLYAISYVGYALVINDIITVDFLHHIQIIVVSLLVLYVGYVAYIQPDIFGNIITAKNGALFKYKKSGLTAMYSKELKENLIKLLHEEKIYKDNDVNLEILSEKLGTTRHNTSQVINEHFHINFFELINRYRIKEVLEILKDDNRKSLNIIDVAYEVGFNNKVTFNKAFKKETSLTPTQYIEMLAREEFIKT